MTYRLYRLCAFALLLATAAQAQAADPSSTPVAGVYRCGNTYSSAPCPGGKAVAAEDARSDTQRQQAQDVKQQDGKLARALSAERRAREQETAGQRAARIGPSEAERAHAQALADKRQAQLNAKKKKRHKPKKADTA